MKQLELGCGDNPRVDKDCTYYVGIDAGEYALNVAELKLENYAKTSDIEEFTFVLMRQQLGFTPIEEKDNTFDFVLGDQFLEHVPRIGYRIKRTSYEIESFNPVINLLNEVCRVTKPGGLVQFNVPKWNSEEQYQDPTHCNQVPPNFWIYWDPADKWDLKKSYGITGSLKMEETIDCGWYYIFKLRNVK